MSEEFDIKTAKDIKPDKLKVIVYGESGIGKTTFASRFPKPLFLDFEEGVSSLAGEDIDYIRILNYTQLLRLPSKLLGADTKYETIVLDPLHQAQRIVMDSCLRLSGSGEVPRIGDWGLCAERMRKLIGMYRDLPLNVVFVCQEQIHKDEILGSIKRLPSLPGKLALEAGGAVDEVYYLRTKPTKEGETKRVLLTQPDGIVYAKSRWHLPKEVEFKLEENIYEKIMHLITRPPPAKVVPLKREEVK